MEKDIQNFLGEQLNNNVKLIVNDARTNELLLSKDINDVFSSASLIKVPILLAVLDHLENQNQSISQMVKITPDNRVEFSVLTELEAEEATLHELLVWMIIVSDNTATNVLIDLLGFEKLNQYFIKIGLGHTRIRRKMMDFVQLESGFDNTTTAKDMALLFTAIYRGELLSKKHSELVINILSRQRINDSLKRYIADDIKIAHKTGSLETVEHDVGIVFTEKNDYIIGVFVTEHTNNEEAKQIIGKISRIIYGHLG
ncbi:serine hydrolase [Lysinibacillus sp. SGAir0095]|uniref:serine hydrolase n=1 Tax=Lysinibacillus sp. SGAir0095 TaxID=2070463 RepID=UPI0010CCECD0|nr:serine hydrolase [Lysinibacillus sp. SGAir0095]QCR33058.1 serine hydrolase [Lysinibacillus sp. SGAir0095]